MNRYFALGCLGLGLMVSPLLSGLAGSAIPQTPRIAVIDIDTTLSTTPAGKRANEEFDKKRATKQTELDKQQTDLKKSAADLDKQKAVMKAEVFQAKSEELQKKFLDLQQTYAKLERELADDRNKLIQKLLKDAQPKIAKIANDEGATIIFDATSVVWADKAVDLTAKLAAEMK